MTETPDRIERALELLLYAPIGVGTFLKDNAPTFVDMFVSRGRAEFDRRQGDVHQRVTTARSLGQVALAFGAPKLRQRVERTLEDAYHRAEGLFGSPASTPSSPSAHARPSTSIASAPAPTPSAERMMTPAWTPPTPTATPSVPATGADGVAEAGAGAAADSAANGRSGGGSSSSAGLPIPGYDALSASQVVERLVGLAPEELAAVHLYEASHRQRRTILGKIEQLAG